MSSLFHCTAYGVFRRFLVVYVFLGTEITISVNVVYMNQINKASSVMFLQRVHIKLEADRTTWYDFEKNTREDPLVLPEEVKF